MLLSPDVKSMLSITMMALCSALILSFAKDAPALAAPLNAARLIAADTSDETVKPVSIQRVWLGPAKMKNRARAYPLMVQLAAPDARPKNGTLLFDASRMQPRQIPFSLRDSATVQILFTSQELHTLAGRRAGLSCLYAREMTDSRFFTLTAEMALQSLFADENLPQEARMLAQMWNDLAENTRWYALLSGDTLDILPAVAAAAWPAAAASNWPQLMTAITTGLGTLIEACKPFKQDTLHLICSPLFSRSAPETAPNWRHVLEILDQFPQIKLSQNDLYWLRILQKSDPQWFEAIRLWSQERRLEWIGTPWGSDLTANDDGESIIRQLQFAADFLKNELGVSPVLGASTQAPGYLPSLLAACGYAGWIHVHPDDVALSAWRAADYAKLDLIAINTRENLPPVDSLAAMIRHAKKNGIGHIPLRFSLTTGQLDVTLQRLDKMINLLAFPAVKFDRWSGYLASVRRASQSKSPGTPANTFHGALCPSPVPGFMAEPAFALRKRQLRQAEILHIMAAIPADSTLPHAWQTLWDETHGAPTSSFDTDAPQEPKTETALHAIATAHPAKGKGVPLMVVNTQPWRRMEPVSFDARAFPPFAVIVDSSGKASPFQTSDSQVVFLAAVPPMGHTTYWLQPGKTHRAETQLQISETTLENEFLKVEISPGSGRVRSIHDKKRQLALLPPGAEALRIDAIPKQSMPGTNLAPDRVEAITRGEEGPVRASLRHSRVSDAVRVLQEIRLVQGTSRMEVHLSGEWHKEVERLDVTIPLPGPLASAWQGSCFGIEALSFARQPAAPRLISEGLQGITRDAGAVVIGVAAPVWGTVTPDKICLHLRVQEEISQEYVPFIFSFILSYEETPSPPQLVLQTMKSAFTPLQAIQPAWNGKEKGAQSGSLLKAEGKDIVLHAVKPARHGDGIILRMTSLTDEARQLTLSGALLSRYRKAYLTNPLEEKREPLLFGKTLTIAFKPYALVTLWLE